MKRKLYSVRESSADFNASDFSVKYYLIVNGAVSRRNIASLSVSRMWSADVFFRYGCAKLENKQTP